MPCADLRCQFFIYALGPFLKYVDLSNNTYHQLSADGEGMGENYVIVCAKFCSVVTEFICGGRPAFPSNTKGCLRNSVRVRITLTSRMVEAI